MDSGAGVGQVIEWIVGGGGIFAILTFSIAIYVRADRQIGRVYQRLDEKTDKLEKEGVPQKVCDVIHKALDSRLQKIEQQTECVPKIKAGVDMLLKKNGIGNA